MLGLLHPLDRRLDGVDPRLDPPRGDHLPRRLRLGRQPLAAALVEGAALEGRLRLRAGLLHARRRRLRRHDQVRRQDAARREDGRPRRRPPRRRGVHLVQGASEEEKARVLEPAGYDMSLDSPDWASIQYQNANNSVRVTDAFMEAAEAGGDWNLTARTDGTVVETVDAREPAAADRRGGVEVRRPGRAVRHDDQRVAHVPEHGPHQRVEPVLRVHVHRRLGVQPRVAEPDEVPPRGRRARRRGVRARGRRRVPRAGDPRRLLVVPDARDRARTRRRTASSGSATRTSARC